MSKSCKTSPNHHVERSINLIAEERAKALVRHQTKREKDYAKNIGLIKTCCKQDEPDIVSNFHIFYLYNYFISCVLFKHQINLILFCF
jgi:hypothetical protein